MSTEQKIEAPKALTSEHLEYLNELRESGQTNMFGAARYLMNEFLDLSEKEAKEILVYWIKTFKG